MGMFRRLLYKSRHTAPVVPVTPVVTANSLMQVINPVYMILQVRPLVDYGLREMSATNPRHAMTEVAIISYLMGMGFEFRTARAIAESWEENEAFFGEGERANGKLLPLCTEDDEQ